MYEKLFTPYKIGNVEIPNRTVVTAMVTNFGTADGMATERYIAYHEEKAKGGYGLIITEDYAVNEHAMGYQYIGGMWKDEHIESHRQLTDRIHKYGTKVFCQIYHAGRQTSARVNGGVQPVAVSPIACPWGRDMPRELTIEEIKGLVKDFGDAAYRVKQTGFDGVEIHAGNGYLISGFMSFHENKRTDEYGGCFTNRMRLLKEIYEIVREKVGPDFPVIVRYSADENVQGGRDLAEARMVAKFMENLGFDAINCSNGVYGTYNKGQVAPMYMPHAWTINNAAELKKIVKIPVIGVNRINDPMMADMFLSMGYCDFVGISRGSLADPNLPNKAKAGDFESIRYCIGCLQGCVGALYTGDPFRCTVNPEMGREYIYNFSDKPPAKKVMVIGGGVAGMEAAYAAARRGHHVSLYEKKAKLGGQFLAASYPPGKGEFSGFLVWLIRQLQLLGVDIRLNTEATAQTVKEENPDKVILASGALPNYPHITGIDRSNVFTAESVLLGENTVEGRIVIAGGGEVGIETALYLAHSERGKITIVEMLDDIAKDMDIVIKVHVMNMAAERGILYKVNTEIKEICEEGVVIEQCGQSELLGCDYVVLALGYKAVNSLEQELAFMGEKLVVIGDAADGNNALIATETGFKAGYNA